VCRLYTYVVNTLFARKKTLKRQLASLLAGLFVAVIAAPTFGSITPGKTLSGAGADPEYVVTFTSLDNTIIGSGTIDATANGDGSYTATTGSITFSSGPDIGTFDLFPNPNGTSQATSPSGAFYYDNQLSPIVAAGGLLDIDGLLFTNGSTEVNLWGNGVGNPDTFDSWTANAGYGSEVVGSFTATAVTTATAVATPEPGTLIIWSLLGGLGMAVGCSQRRKTA